MEPDILLEIALGLPDAPAVEAAEALPSDQLSMLVATAVDLARSEPDDLSLERLDVLRRVCILRGARPAVALLLMGIAEVAMALERPREAVPALETLIRVRDLLKQPAKAHDAALLLASAQARAAMPGRAEATLNNALDRARAIAGGGNLAEATTLTAATLIQLGTLMASQGRDEEAEAWLAGAVDMAADEETGNEARAAYAAFLGARGRRTDAFAVLGT